MRRVLKFQAETDQE